VKAASEMTSVVQHFPAVTRRQLHTLQVNLGYRCNQACSHCHVDAGPDRTEMMDRATIDTVLEFLVTNALTTLDLTGGSPELNPHFRNLVTAARAANINVIDRCNLTILNEPGQEDLAEFLAASDVQVIASMPCYSRANVEEQRGKGVYDRSLEGLRQLNRLGFGRDDSDLRLDLVYNPHGPNLPPPAAQLEADYKREFAELGIHFNRLLTITNMPIKRFRHALQRDGHYDDYMQTLHDNFAVENLTEVMCRTLLSVDWRGYIYDCDFNQMLAMPAGGRRRHLSEVLDHTFADDKIAVDDHCFGCTAGAGSSCSGALRL